MIEATVPGFKDLQLSHLVLDYNGTLAVGGRLLPGVVTALTDLADQITIHVITADTFGLAAEELMGLPVKLTITSADSQSEAKLIFVESLGSKNVAAIGNGRNDRAMLKAAALGIALIQSEGGSIDALTSADISAINILDALNLLRNPNRIIATLRS